MKTILKYFACAVLVVFIFDNFIYHKITHLSKDDLTWITNSLFGDIMVFESCRGDFDTLVIDNVEIENSVFPFRIDPNHQEYIGFAQVHYLLSHNRDTLEGHFRINKNHLWNPVQLDIRLDGRAAYGLECTLSPFEVSGEIINDCITMDDSNSRMSQNDMFRYDIQSLVWSKKYGLIQYTFKDGEAFTRTDIGKQLKKEKI